MLNVILQMNEVIKITSINCSDSTCDGIVGNENYVKFNSTNE